MEPADASDAKFYMDKTQLRGRQITVVYAEENRKKPAEMRQKERMATNFGGGGYMRRRSPVRRVRGRSRSRSWSRSSSRSRSPSSSYGRGRSRSPPPRRTSVSPAYGSPRGPARGRSPARGARSPYESRRSPSPRSPRRSPRSPPYPSSRLPSDGPADRSRHMPSVKS